MSSKSHPYGPDSREQTPDDAQDPDPSRVAPGKRPLETFEIPQEEIQALRNAIQNSNLVQLSLQFLDYILRAQTAIFEQIYKRRDLPRMIASMAILSVLLSASYGVAMGLNHSLLQAVSSAIKLPLLFLLTALICTPSLYTFNIMLGQRFRFQQIAALVTSTLGATSILLISLAPIALFFNFTTQNYSFLVLMHVAIFGLCGLYGVQYLHRGCSYLVFRMEQPLNRWLLKIWILLYAIVGMQLSWRLSPFVANRGDDFMLLTDDVQTNFYMAVWNALMGLIQS